MKNALCVVVLSLALAGCYRYVPEAAPSPTLGADYRARLSESGTTSLAPLLGSGTVAFDGRFIEDQGNAWTVAVAGTLKRGESRTTIWEGERVRVTRADVTVFERRMIDRRRTTRAVVLGVLGGVGVGALLYAVGGKVKGNPGGGGEPPNAVR